AAASLNSARPALPYSRLTATPCLALNRDSRPSRGCSRPISSGTSGLQRNALPVISARPPSSASLACAVIVASIAGCATTPHGYVLIVFCSSSQRCPSGQPRPSASRSTLAASATAPPPPPGGPAAPPSPAAANRAASTPLAAAFPACSGL